MSSRLWLLIGVLLALLQTPASAEPAHALGDFAGRWAFRVGGRVMLILQLQPTPDGRGLAGDFTRPQRFTIGANGRDASGVLGPIVSQPVLAASVDGRVLHLTVRDASDPEHPTALDFMRTGADTGELAFAGLPTVPMPMTRVGPAAQAAADWDPSRLYEAGEVRVDNPEMTRLYDADQADRRDPAHIDWDAVSKADAERRAATARLLESGALRSGADFAHAAFVFQHGSAPNDYLRAHTLAMVAMKKGNGAAVWIAAASLDRYLQAIGQPQIYGTQSHGQPGQATQAPYDRTLIPDALRIELDVATQAQQAALLDASNSPKPRQ